MHVEQLCRENCYVEKCVRRRICACHEDEDTCMLKTRVGKCSQVSAHQCIQRRSVESPRSSVFSVQSQKTSSEYFCGCISCSSYHVGLVVVVYIYIYIYIYTHTHTHTHIYMYIQTQKAAKAKSMSDCSSCSFYYCDLVYLAQISRRPLANTFVWVCSSSSSILLAGLSRDVKTYFYFLPCDHMAKMYIWDGWVD